MRRISKWLSKFIRAPPISNIQLAHYRLDVWQKRHGQTPSALPNLALACPAAPAPAYAPAARLYAAIAAFSLASGFERSAAGCIHALVAARDAEVLEPRHPLRANLLRCSPLQPVGGKTRLPAARSTRTSAAKLPAQRHFHTPQSCGLGQRHTSCLDKRDRATAAPSPASIPAAAAHR